MKFDPKKYRRDQMVDKLRAHAQRDDDEFFRKVKGDNAGVSYEINTTKGWLKKHMSFSQIDKIIGELSEL